MSRITEFKRSSNEEIASRVLQKINTELDRIELQGLNPDSSDEESFPNEPTTLIGLSNPDTNALTFSPNEPTLRNGEASRKINALTIWLVLALVVVAMVLSGLILWLLES